MIRLTSIFFPASHLIPINSRDILLVLQIDIFFLSCFSSPHHLEVLQQITEIGENIYSKNFIANIKFIYSKNFTSLPPNFALFAVVPKEREWEGERERNEIVCLSQGAEKWIQNLFFFSLVFVSNLEAHSPKGTAGVNHPVAGCFLSYPFFDECLFAAEEFHGQPVVGRLEPCL